MSVELFFHMILDFFKVIMLIYIPVFCAVLGIAYMGVKYLDKGDN